MTRALRRRYGRASARDPMSAFRTAARKIEKAIAALEAGGDINARWSEENHAVAVAINRLEDRANKPEIRGDDRLREEAWAIASSLRQRRQAAEESGWQARQGLVSAEMRGIKERERERIANMSPSERALYNYQQELKLTRGR